MGKTIRITAIIAFALKVLQVIAGDVLIPLITGIIYSNRALSYSSEPVKELLISMGVYFVTVIIGLVIPLLYLGFMFALIAASKSQKSGIALEVLGLICMGLAVVMFIPAKAFCLWSIEMCGNFGRWVKQKVISGRKKEK